MMSNLNYQCSEYPCGEQIIINNAAYRIGSLINKGTDGRIYAAHSKDGMDSAVKYFRCVYGDELWLSALREIEAFIRLAKCAYTVKMLGYCARKDDNGDAEVFILMERMECCSQMNMSEMLTLQMAADVSLALEYIGRRGLVHCDVKPSNIFLSSSGVWQLGDFGCMQRKGKCIRRGSPAYCSPEAYRGERCDIRSDIYSLGIVIYKLLCGGRFPFCRESAHLMRESDVDCAIERRLSGEQISRASELSGEMNDLLLEMCEFDPNKRLSSPKAINRIIKSMIENRTEG